MFFCVSDKDLHILDTPLSLVREVKVGDPNNPNNMLGALVSKEHMAKVKGYIELARSEGCTVLCGDGVDELNLPEPNKNVSYLCTLDTCTMQCSSFFFRNKLPQDLCCVVLLCFYCKSHRVSICALE